MKSWFNFLKPEKVRDLRLQIIDELQRSILQQLELEGLEKLREITGVIVFIKKDMEILAVLNEATLPNELGNLINNKLSTKLTDVVDVVIKFCDSFSNDTLQSDQNDWFRLTYCTERVAVLRVENGQAAKTTYLFDGKTKQGYEIGRGQRHVLPSGKVHINDIVFTDTSANQSISRHHASIRYEKKRYILYPGEGVIANQGRLKVNTSSRLNRAGLSYTLNQGDQIIIGNEAVLFFEETLASTSKP